MFRTLHLHLLVFLIIPLHLLYPAEDEAEFIDPHIIEMSPFVVYGGLIDTIDGFTEQEYHEDNPVVLGFREEFNNLLLGYHKKLLVTEYQHMTKTLEIEKAFHADLIALGASFGFPEVDWRSNSFSREKSITNRLIKDPFFIIDALLFILKP